MLPRRTAEDIPAQRTVRRLRADNVPQPQRAGAQHYTHQRQTQGELVADDLGGGPQTAEEREFIVGTPAGERDAVYADGGNAQDDQQTHVQI